MFCMLAKRRIDLVGVSKRHVWMLPNSFHAQSPCIAAMANTAHYINKCLCLRLGIAPTRLHVVNPVLACT